MGGLANICKLYGSVEITGNDGKKVVWLYDYANDKPRLKSEMTKEEIMASEKAKWSIIGEQQQRRENRGKRPRKEVKNQSEPF